jgi:hypothetical protein
MVRLAKKAMALLLAVMVVMSSATVAFAATGSPAEGEDEVKGKNGSLVNIDEEAGTLSLVEYHSVKGKKISVPKKVKTAAGKSYKLTAIESYAFQYSGTQVITVVLTKNIVSIKKNAFYGLTNLRHIHLKKTKGVKFASNAFNGVPSKCVIKVSKNLTKAQLKAVKAAVKKAGFKGKVKRATTF